MKLDFKSATKSIMSNGKEVGLTLGGALISRKFLDFDVMFKAQEPNSFLRKHQGIIKFLVGTVGAGYVKKESVLRPILNGIALEGGIKAVRTYGGGTFFQPLGETDILLGEGDNDGLLGEGDSMLADILEGADNMGANDMGADDMGSIVNQYPEGVSGAELTANAFSTVSGVADDMGADDMGAHDLAGDFD